MTKVAKDASLEEAKVWLREQFEKKGARCPCCQQFVKLYKRRLNASMAYVLILLYRYDQRHGGARNGTQDPWVHVPSYLVEASSANIRRAAAIRGDWAKLKYWGLIEELDTKREDGSKRAGYYRITERGKGFVLGNFKVPPYIFLYNEKVLDRPVAADEWITIGEALGKKFDYTELMQETT